MHRWHHLSDIDIAGRCAVHEILLYYELSETIVAIDSLTSGLHHKFYQSECCDIMSDIERWCQVSPTPYTMHTHHKDEIPVITFHSLDRHAYRIQIKSTFLVFSASVRFPLLGSPRPQHIQHII